VLGFLRAAFATDAGAAKRKFGPFTIDDNAPQLIMLDGELDDSSALNFRRALAASPQANLIVLNSPGGLVQMGLLIADDVHRRAMATHIPADSECLSSCSFIFLAGKERKADGDLGVHQIWNEASDTVSVQYAVSDIIEVLNRFGTPIEVMQIMFSTPPDEMHVFSSEEVARYRLNKVAGNDPSPSESNPPGSEPSLPQTAAREPSSQPSTQRLPNLSAFEQYASRPNRMAIYTGLDLFGGDIDSARAADAAACARRCLQMGGKCKAFTFNISRKLKRGPNCFLKSNPRRADGNSMAFSGRLLTALDSNPPKISLGTIDPETALFENVDLPGGDLSLRPARSARSVQSCRLACIDETNCVAFTYVKSRKECWLKGSVSTPVSRRGMLSGLKSVKSFEPSTILGLD
jgi:hypothetical protein